MNLRQIWSSIVFSCIWSLGFTTLVIAIDIQIFDDNYVEYTVDQNNVYYNWEVVCDKLSEIVAAFSEPFDLDKEKVEKCLDSSTFKIYNWNYVGDKNYIFKLLMR